ncbi:MAG: M23 family metallopeptidase [Chryseobacterium sp.]|uniref:peptidoglycan DD-metalloendopeptidase family protein n=1 Tax=Chryseobacterium sp. TaxID=1871047 RepID=UPI001B0FCD3E|nr:peptidoglycan DD-metalloendopeptidase family protein [Chryseobacterium sp.]MBO6184348.1 M23 family metallopeptidase [Chryseobacterium sp.]
MQKSEGKSTTIVEELKVENTEEGKCGSCQIFLTVNDLDNFMSATPHGSILKKAPYNSRIPAYIYYLNQYMTEFEINKNCYRRANFLGQVAKETKFWSYKEDFVFKSSVLKSKFSNFKTEQGKKNADLWGYNIEKSEITKEREIKIANWAYARGNKASDLGNRICPENDVENPEQDGYKYRGRGLIQLTGRNNYTNFQSWYNENKTKLKLPNADFISTPDLVFEPQYIVLSAIYFWTKNGLNEIADVGVEKETVQKISNTINSGEEQVKKDVRYDYVRSAHSMLSEKARDCPLETKYESPTGKWHDPVDNPICTLYMQSGGGGEAGKHWGLFGQTRNGSDHVGLDLFATKGTNIYACVDGTIYNRRWHGGYGNTVTIKVKNPQEFLKFKKKYSLQYTSKGEINKGSSWSEDGDIYLFYGHLDSVIDYKFGQEITCGEVLGTTGRSGVVKGTCAPHLHFEVLSDYVMGSRSIRTRINPAFFVDYKGYNEQSAAEKKKQEDEKNKGKTVQHDGVKKLPYADMDGFIK